MTFPMRMASVAAAVGLATLAACSETPDQHLISSIRDGSIADVRTAIAAKANVNFVSGDGDSPLTAASVTCKPDVVKLLIDSGAQVNEMAPDALFHDPEPALIAASGSIEKDCPEVIALLLQAGADPNAKSSRVGFTALGQAALEGNVASARVLLNAGADPNGGVITPLSFASGSAPGGASAENRAAVAQLLRDHGGHL